MKWSTAVASATVTLAIAGCDRIPFLSRGDSDTTAIDTAAAVQAPPDTQTAVMTPPTPQPRTPPAPVQRTRPAAPQMDQPWTPTDTGTVSPGMTRDQVVAVWGVPVAERRQGARTYLYFRNGCEVTCGTFDVVFLEGDQVVDAIVRGRGHHYAGVSSSPPERAAEFTPPRRPGSMGDVP